MKKTIFLLLSLVILASCGDIANQKLDPNDVLSIRPAKGVQTRSTEHLTALEIVKQTLNMEFIAIETGKPAFRGFADVQRDLNPEAPRLKMWGTDIISTEGKLSTHFVDARDLVLTDANNDTIAYIPNKIFIETKPQIVDAFDKGDFQTVYNLFDNAYRFTPISAKEWKELKKQGIQ